NISAQNASGNDLLPHLIAGILENISDMTAFLNPSLESYDRFGVSKAPQYVSWSSENRSQLIRVPAAVGEYRRAELRSPDPSANPYLAFALLIYAGLYGIQNKLLPPAAANFNLFTADPGMLKGLQKLPASLDEAIAIMQNSSFIREHIPHSVLTIYSKNN
ncbi:MAG: type I glutamate--ammonia ligase, partial [Clostridia bacterium]|nr:type I glutamate--ammonia ligase [Clostridia bacterium]